MLIKTDRQTDRQTDKTKMLLKRPYINKFHSKAKLILI